MSNPSDAGVDLTRFTPDQLHAAFFSRYTTTAERISAVEGLLRGPSGQVVREQVGGWVIERLALEKIVPEKHARWRPLVRDAMLFMFMHLCVERLAPKLIEQLELPPETSPEARLLILIARVPGLQKLGQVVARNRALHRSLRRALGELENGISDMKPEQVRAIIFEELGPRLKACVVKVRPGIFCEASVSAVVRFTWWNPELKQRERGVFKVMKPYIPACFAEDMELLAGLASYLGSKHRGYGFAKRVLPNTFNDVRRLLQHEVDFPREQSTLLEAHKVYSSVPGVRVPRLIEPLCTSNITAMTEERGKKVTEAVKQLPGWRRAVLSEQLIEALLAVPMFSTEKDALFHADPHAGNLLYDRSSGKLAILDWALTERVSRDHRRHLAMLILMTSLRDPDRICNQLLALSRGGPKGKAARAKVIRQCVDRFMRELPLTRMPGAVDAMDLLETVALTGIRMPASLVMMRKVLFTLDGVQRDLGGPEVGMVPVIARHALPRWLTSWTAFGLPLSLRDWLAVQSSTLFYGGRLCWQGAQALLERSRAAAGGR